MNLLIQNGADVNVCRKGQEHRTALNIASKKGHVDVVNLLIQNNANMGHALFFGAEYGRVEVVKLLILNGAEVNAEDQSSYTAITYAVQKGHVDVVRQLILGGVDVNCLNKDGRSPLHEA